MSSMIEIDGSTGEGGGQILRTSLALSLVTGRPIRIDHIRAARRKPGLMRQHLTCVRAATAVGQAEVAGDEIGSTTLEFRPATVVGGDHEFAIGGAGSTVLVVQTVLPALLTAAEPSRLVVRGGTHNPMAPSFDHFDRAFRPVLCRMGADVGARLHDHGFAPAGGGCIEVSITPRKALRRIDILERGNLLSRAGRVLVSNLPIEVGEREKAVLAEKWFPMNVEVESVASPGPGNAVVLEVTHGDDEVREVVTAHGERGTSAERVAKEAVRLFNKYIRGGAPVGVHLADQLLVPMALAGGGSFATHKPSRHLTTNAEVVQRFLDIGITIERIASTTRS